MIAGPNGAGKTTMTLELIANQALFYEFVNADEIARGLAPLHPESMSLTASKFMLNRLKHHVPEESVVRRYYAGLKNLITHYLPLCGYCSCCG